MGEHNNKLFYILTLLLYSRIQNTYKLNKMLIITLFFVFKIDSISKNLNGEDLCNTNQTIEIKNQRNLLEKELRFL